MQNKNYSFNMQLSFVPQIGSDPLVYTTKLENELGWRADEDFDSGIVKAIEWYLNKYK